MELLPKHFKKLKSNLGGIRMPKLEKYFKHQDSTRIAIFLFSLGLLLFILISTVAPFRSKLFSFLFSKPYSNAASSNCGLTNPAFCDTFDAPMGTGKDRSGDLNGLIWGVSRVRGGGNNSAQGQFFNWVTNLRVQGSCGSVVTSAPNDIKICNGQLNEAVNDNYTLDAFDPLTAENAGGDVTALTMYPKQPFDFAGRTGKVVFDVSDDSAGMHSAWPEFWMTNKPVPNPFTHFSSWQSIPEFGFGLRLGAACEPGQGGNCAPHCPSNNTTGVVTVASVITINNFIENDQDNEVHPGTVQLIKDGCVKEPTQPGQLNHFEIDVSQSQIDIYATDAGTTSPLIHLGTVPNANLGFTKGLIWLEDVHYNGSKDLGVVVNGQRVYQGYHTFTWDNVGFDGPFTYRDLAFEAPDRLQSVPAYPNTKNFGWYAFPPPAPVTVTVPGVYGNTVATSAQLVFNLF